MKTITKKHTISQFTSKQFKNYFGNMKMGIFDIETLGLRHFNTPMILAGFMTLEENECTLTQYFAEDPSEEILLLEHLKNDFNNVDFLLTYNGKHFDIPFIEKRADILGVKNINTNIYNLDLYLVLNGHSEVKHCLRNLKQKSVEEYMQLDVSRADEISGAESIKLYENYLSCSDPYLKNQLEHKILLHNHDDLLQLYQILPILKQVDIHKAFYSLGFPVIGMNGWPTLNVCSIKINNVNLTISGKYYGEKFSYISFEDFDKSYSCEFTDDGKFIFNLRIDKHKGNIFINLLNYFEEYESFKTYPNVIKDFIVASINGKVHHMEVNSFVKQFLNKFMNDSICPLMTL